MTLIFIFWGKNNNPKSFLNKSGQGFAMNTENMVSAYGITSVGMVQEIFEVEGLTEGLQVEELYISSGTEVSEGDKILKLSQESVETARKELEQILREADLAYRSGSIAYEQSLIEAEYNKESTILQGSQAKEIYDETVASLSDSIEEAEKKLADAKEEIAEYEEMMQKGYYEYYKVGEYQALYDENLDLLKEKMEEWGAGWSQVTGQGGAKEGNPSVQNSNQGDVSGGNAGNSEGKKTPDSSQLKVLQSLYSILEDNLKDLEDVQDKYEEAVRSAELEKQMLEYSLSTLESNLEEAKENYETRLLQAELTYEQSLATAKRAESDYQAEVEKALSDYESLKDAKEDAQENLTLFEELVGDGYYYALGSGTVLRTGVRTNQYLKENSVVFMYSNPEKMDITVSVEQEDIGKLSVGDSAYVQSDEAGIFEGIVAEINPITGSDSRTNITYSVTVSLTTESEGLSTNETVAVFFETGGDIDENEEKE